MRPARLDVAPDAFILSIMCKYEFNENQAAHRPSSSNRARERSLHWLRLRTKRLRDPAQRPAFQAGQLARLLLERRECAWDASLAPGVVTMCE